MWFILLVTIMLLLFVVPAIKAYLAYRRLKNRFNEMFGFGNASTNGPAGSRQTQREQHRPRRKKIDASVGEYVEFEEISVTETENRPTDKKQTSFKTESQIVDVEWEDIKE